MIMKSSILKKTIESALNIEANQKVKAQKRDQAYMMNTIEEFRNEVHNIQVAQTKSKNSKPVILAEPL